MQKMLRKIQVILKIEFEFTPANPIFQGLMEWTVINKIVGRMK